VGFFSKSKHEKKFNNPFILVALFFFAMQSLSIASGVDEFARLSQKKDALIEGDCQRYGGTQKIPELDNPFVTLSKKGEKLGGYNNVIGFNRHIYIVVSVPAGGWFAKNVMGKRRMTICKF
jgi:hypothetical protein